MNCRRRKISVRAFERGDLQNFKKRDVNSLNDNLRPECLANASDAAQIRGIKDARQMTKAVEAAMQVIIGKAHSMGQLMQVKVG